MHPVRENKPEGCECIIQLHYIVPIDLVEGHKIDNVMAYYTTLIDHGFKYTCALNGMQLWQGTPAIRPLTSKVENPTDKNKLLLKHQLCPPFPV